MRLYLSSYHLSAHPEEFANLRTGSNRVAIIMNATDGFDSSKHDEYFEREASDMRSIGLEPEELDLRDFFGRPDALARKLGSFGLTWVTGGNSFVLRRAMRQSGFDQVAPPLIETGQLVYGGYSAGSVVVTPTLRHIDLDDDPTVVPNSYEKAPIYDGLGLFDKSIAPHYQSDHAESELMEIIIQRFIADGMPYQALRDGQAIIVRDEQEFVVDDDAVT